jgi:hypothetical protein
VDIGAYQVFTLNYFSNGAVADGTNVTSYINQSNLILAVQSDYSDPFLDATNQIGKVYVYYQHSAGREQKKLIHTGSNLSAVVQWSPYALDGTWQKIKAKVFDNEGASHIIYRNIIGSGEDIMHSSGAIHLNVS